ncbi:MAG: hypothetical protein II222_04500 [Paraprevotella sp.]|nr:hypothetical protein [Paraprevotella sp.]
MSDGNYNRSLLPHTPYHSGLQTGKAMAKMKASEAFRETISQAMPDLDSEKLNKLTVQFTSNLSRKI